MQQRSNGGLGTTHGGRRRHGGDRAHDGRRQLGSSGNGLQDIDLGTLGGLFSDAVAINNSGRVVGTANTAAGANHGFSWTQVGGIVNIGTLGGDYSTPTGVNDSGQVVGFSSTATSLFGRAFSWTPAGGMIPIGTLATSAPRARSTPRARR